MYFYSKQDLLLVFFDLHVVRQADKDIDTIHLRVVRLLLDIFFSSGTVSSLIVSLGFIPVIDDTVLFILFTAFFNFLDTFSGS